MNVIFTVDAPPVATEETLAAASDEEEELIPLMVDRCQFCASVDPRTTCRPGDMVRLAVDPTRFHFSTRTVVVRSKPVRSSAPARERDGPVLTLPPLLFCPSFPTMGRMPGGRRSPMLRAVRELARVRESVGHDRPLSLDEAISRRDFLRVGGVLGAGAAVGGLAACTIGRDDRPAPSPSSGGARVVVVGAGLAGLTCADRLSSAGVSVELYEARDRVGGRCWSARGFADGQVGEHGGEFIDTRHVHLRRLVRELDLELDDLWEGWIDGSRSLYWFDGADRRRAEIFADADGLVRSLRAIAPDVLPYGWQKAGPASAALDRTSMAEWLGDHLPGWPDSVFSRWLRATMDGWFGLEPEELSAMSLVDFFVAPVSGDDERYHVRGGNDQVTERLAERLPQDSIHLGSPLEALSRRSDDRIELRFTGLGSSVVADRVVLALPFTTLRETDLADAGFSAHRLRAIDELGMATNAKVLLQFDRRFQAIDRWSGVLERDDPALGTWASSDAQSGRSGLLTVYSGGRTGADYPAEVVHGRPSSGVLDETIRLVDEVVPGTAAGFNGRAWIDAWVHDPWVRGSYAAFLPGQYTDFWGYTKLAEGPIHFAGEHTSTHSQGYLNGGVESGERAAREALRALAGR